MDSFRRQILDRLAETGLTYADLAEKSGVSRAYVYRVLDGSQVPSMAIADRIAAALGLVITTAPAA